MLQWSTATDVFEVASGARRFHNPSADGAPPPFPAFVEPPVERLVDAPPAPDPLAPPDDAVGALVGRGSLGRDAIPEFSAFGDKALVRVLAASRTDRYGFGEVCGSLRHDSRLIVGSTSDSFAYDDRRPNLYQAHPWGLCVRSDGSAFGVIVETTYRFTAHIFDGLLIEVDGPPPAVTVIEGADAAEVLRGLGTLCGTSPLPPRWALGYHQSRWNYAPASQALEIAQEFRARSLPAEVIWIDIDYMDGYRVFTFDPDFGDPSELNAALHDIGWRSAWMIDPGVKIEDGYGVYDELTAGGHAMVAPDGQPFEGLVWPGPVVWPDFTRADTRRWWGALYADFLGHGIDAVWNDMNEPANLDFVPDKAVPGDVLHDADDELGGAGDHARYRNVYGMLMSRASLEGMQAAQPDRRHFLLTRSTFLGGHRYAATWTGDNVSSWEHLAWSIPMALNLALSGQSMAGPDIGGFVGHCTGPLLARWMGIGCLFPFARNHNMRSMPDQEPWCFGEDVEATSRRALERRYRLLPYLYTLARDAADTGLPIMRPAFFADHGDAALRDVDTAFLLGDDLYVRCDVTETRSGATAPVPVGWRRVHLLDDDALDPDLPELYLRPGAVLPLGPIVQWSDERPLDQLELVAHLDGGVASGQLYEDAGDGHAHLSGGYRRCEFHVRSDGTWDVTRTDGDWETGRATWSVRVRIVGDAPR